MPQFFRKKVPPFAYEIPYWTIEDDLLVHTDGQTFTKGLILTGADTWCFSDGMLNEFSDAIKIWISGLSEDICMQVYCLSDENVQKEVKDFYDKTQVGSELRRQI